MAADDAQKILAEEILQDARRRESEILAAAKAEAAKMLSEAHAVARTEAEKIFAEHNARARRRAEMILRMVTQEVARGKLRARDAVIQSAFDQAWARLSNIPLDQYKQVVVRLAVAAIRQMPASDFVVEGRRGRRAEPGRGLAGFGNRRRPAERGQDGQRAGTAPFGSGPRGRWWRARTESSGGTIRSRAGWKAAAHAAKAEHPDSF